MFKTYVLPSVVSSLWVANENPLSESEASLEKEEQEVAKYYESISNAETSFVPPGFEHKEESEEEEEEVEMGEESERELEEYADDLQASSVANNEGSEHCLSLIHICRCRRYAVCRSRWSPYH
eukprot:TRINITY_DN6441_c0_g1_i5.p2 TRINITY_DN6441_c0_g1~~TRINITY_DN6441_c0_g1_i5.p2  ORF type:complete len:123 (-),score=48.23 TRINITY_DN6441_c0_g1_i5:34-402(-)